MDTRLAIAISSVVLSIACSTSDGGAPGLGAAGSGGAGGADDAAVPVDATADRTPEDVVDASTDSSPDAFSDAPAEASTDADPVEVGPDGSCPAVTAAPDMSSFSMRLPSAGFGGVETVSHNGHTDVFLKSPTDYTRVGVRLDWGGTVVFFGLSSNAGSNVIDANDTGRELQIALYDPTRAHQPCAADATCVSSPASCGNSITFLGWNPVQGGDECNHGAPVLSHGAVGDALEVVVQPLQWNPDWDKPDCTQTACGTNGRPVDVTYRMLYRFVTEHVVEIATEVTSQESIDHPVSGQEWPTLYVSHGQQGPDLPVLRDASGQVVTIDNPGNDGFYWENFDSPAPWVTWQNADSSYGVGLGMDQGTTAFQGWRGDGTSSPYFHNVRAQVAFGLDGGAAVRGVSYLVLGSFATVKAEMEGVFGQRAPFGSVDEPAGGAAFAYPAGTPVAVRGWALDNTAGTQVRVEIDGATVATLGVDGDRPDVCKVYPAYPACPAVGFGGVVPTASLDACAHLLRVVAFDAQGNERVLGERVIVPQ